MGEELQPNQSEADQEGGTQTGLEWWEFDVPAEERFWAELNILLRRVVRKTGRPRADAPASCTARVSRNTRVNWRRRRTFPDVDTFAETLAADIINDQSKLHKLLAINRAITARIDVHLKELEDKLNQKLMQHAKLGIAFLPSFISFLHFPLDLFEEIECAHGSLDNHYLFSHTVKSTLQEHTKVYADEASKLLGSTVIQALAPVMVKEALDNLHITVDDATFQQLSERTNLDIELADVFRLMYESAFYSIFYSAFWRILLMHVKVTNDRK